MASFSNIDATAEGALGLDAADPLRALRELFHIPLTGAGQGVIYFTGNSLGLQPLSTRDAVNEVLDDWKELGVDGHLRAKNPWLPYHERLTRGMASIVGALPKEVVIMNSLTVNLHLLMASFYRPSGLKRKILIEHHAFPSDRYAVRSQIAWHGLDPTENLIVLGEKENSDVLDESSIESELANKGEEIALLLIGGVNYYSGQLFDMERITRAAHDVGVVVGFDLAHAAGNVPLALHDWDVDFAAWCSYKYLNAGPGGPAGIFVHDSHGNDPGVPRLAGWWGHDKTSRFAMPDEFNPITGAEGWQVSNPPVLSLAALKASLDVFESVGMDALREKSIRLSDYLRYLIEKPLSDRVEIITPRPVSRHGAQLSLRVLRGENNAVSGWAVFDYLESVGTICDWREPDILRLAPVPLYNSFTDAFRFAQQLKDAFHREDTSS